MGISAFEILDIAELIFFVPAMVVAGVVVRKHGLHKQLGWRFLLMICLFRIIGATVSLISVHHPSEGLTITYDVTNSFGLSAVISTALALLERVNVGCQGHGMSQRLFHCKLFPDTPRLVNRSCHRL
jgi:hypothetical protein